MHNGMPTALSHQQGEETGVLENQSLQGALPNTALAQGLARSHLTSLNLINRLLDNRTLHLSGSAILGSRHATMEFQIPPAPSALPSPLSGGAANWQDVRPSLSGYQYP